MICNECKYAGQVKAECEARNGYCGRLQTAYLATLHAKCKTVRKDNNSYCTCQHRVERKNV